MSVTVLSIAFVAVALVADGAIFLLLWERVRRLELAVPEQPEGGLV